MMAHYRGRRRLYWMNPEAWEISAKEWGDPQIDPVIQTRMHRSMYGRGALAVMRDMGIKIGVLGDFLRGARARRLFREVLDVPVYYQRHLFDKTWGVYQTIDEGGPAIIIYKEGDIDDLAETLFHEAAHALRDLRRPKRSFDYETEEVPQGDEWEKYGFERSAEKMAQYVRDLKPKEAGHREMVAEALATGKPVPQKIAEEYPELHERVAKAEDYTRIIPLRIRRDMESASKGDWEGAIGVIPEYGAFLVHRAAANVLEATMESMGLRFKGDRASRLIQFARLGNLVIVDGTRDGTLRVDIVTKPTLDQTAAILEMLRQWKGDLKYRLHVQGTAVEGTGIENMHRDIDRAWQSRRF